MEKQTEFTQNLKEKAEFRNVYYIHLLFTREPQRPDLETIRKALEKRCGEVDVVSRSSQLSSFAVKKYPVTYKDDTVPAQVLMTEVREFEQDSIDSFARSQLWDVRDGSGLLETCRYEVVIFDMMAAGLDYKDRCELLMDWMETAVRLFEDCTAVWFEPAGKLLTAEQVQNCSVPGESRFVYFGVNARLFNIQGSDAKVVDTLGLYAVGLPDVQYHFRGLEPGAVVNHAYNVASYLYSMNASINSGETIDGIRGGRMSQDVQWTCRYEEALIQPARQVLDICPGEYAAGKRCEQE